MAEHNTTPAQTLNLPATLRQISALAEVSAMTVSRALGNRPRVAAATRERVLRIAAELGYRPDPELNKLMHHLRSQRRLRFQSVICGLSTRLPGSNERYFRALVAGAKRQAESRGYGFMQMRVAAGPAERSGLHRSLRARGVQGVLLLPQHEPIDLRELLVWEEFSTVAATASVLAPEVNRVTPNQFANALLLCRRLAERGYRRPGFVTSAEHDRRVEHHFDAAFLWHGVREARLSAQPLVREEVDRESLVTWFRRERPDVIVATEQKLLFKYARWLGLRVPGPIGLASTNVHGVRDAGPTGIDERPAEIGAVAVDMLASMIERRVRGLPVAPSITLLPGEWRPGRTAQVRK